MKTVQLEYGRDTCRRRCPIRRMCFIAGETVADPPYLPDVVVATRESIRRPVGMPPISQLVGPGKRVTISFPDRVKGGFQANSHRKTAIPLLIQECLAAGVAQRDILLICSNGLHRKKPRRRDTRAFGGRGV